jgi:RNA polymerase sigma factor (sigma-70 family)
MRDSEVVAAIVSGNPAGLDEAYGRYAAPLYAYSRSLLGSPEDAAGAVLDTFVVASSKLRDLRDPERLRPWLYTVTRNACRRRLNAGAQRASLEEEARAADEPGAIGGGNAQRALVRAAVAALTPDQRDVVELSLRHKLSGQDLADVLGVSRGRANALAVGARRDLRRSLRTLSAARLGRADCPELDALLVDWDGQLTDLLRKRVRRHTEHCVVCGERERADQAPEMMLSLLPVVGVPAELRRLVLEVGGNAAQTADLTPLIGHRAEPFDTSGFPAALDRPRALRLTGRTVRAAATGSAAVAVVVVVAAVALKAQHEAISPAAAATGPGSVAAASATPSPGTRHGVSLGRSGKTPGTGAAPVIGATATPGASPAPRTTTPAPRKTTPAPTKTSPTPKPTTPKPTTPVPTTPVPTTPVPTSPVPTTTTTALPTLTSTLSTSPTVSLSPTASTSPTASLSATAAPSPTASPSPTVVGVLEGLLSSL